MGYINFSHFLPPSLWLLHNNWISALSTFLIVPADWNTLPSHLYLDNFYPSFGLDVISSRKKCCWPPRPGKGGSSVLAWFLSTHHFPYCGIFHNSEWISCLFIYLSPTGWNHYEGRALICCVHYIHRYFLNIKTIVIMVGFLLSSGTVLNISMNEFI